MGYALSTYGADHMYGPHDGIFTDEKFRSFRTSSLWGFQSGPCDSDTSEKVRMYALLENLFKVQDTLDSACLDTVPGSNAS